MQSNDCFYRLKIRFFSLRNSPRFHRGSNSPRIEKFLLLAFIVFFATQALATAVLIKPIDSNPISSDFPPQNLPTIESQVLDVPHKATYEAVSADKNLNPKLLNLGLNTEFGFSYVFSELKLLSLSGIPIFRFSLVFDDPLLLGSYMGLSDDAVQYKVGTGYVSGSGNNQYINMVPLFLASTIYLKEKSFFGYDPFINLGLNYTLIGRGSSTSGVGFSLGYGMLYDFGIKYGKTAFLASYNSFQLGSEIPSYGISLSISQPIVL